MASPKISSTYSTLDSIDNNLESKCILVRLLPTWEARDFRRNNVLLNVDCLFVDEKNIAIQTSIHPRRFHKFKTKLKEGNVFSITTFDVKLNPKYYRLTDNANKIFFNDKTTMDEVHDVNQSKIPEEYFRIMSLEGIKNIVGKGENLPDVVAKISSIRTWNRVDESKIPPKSTFNLVFTCTFENGGTAYISFWEKFASEVHGRFLKLPQGPNDINTTVCNHKFHHICLTTWLCNKTTCPYCRRDLL